MKKITILAHHLGYGGIEQYISHLCKMLVEDYEIEVVATYKVSDTPAFHFDERIKIKYLINDRPYKDEWKNSIKKLNIFKFLKYTFLNIKILSLFKRVNINYIKKMDSDYCITTKHIYNSLVGKYINNDIVTIATEHNYIDNKHSPVKKVIKSLSNINYFVVVSKSLKEFYENKIGSTKCIYIPNVLEEVSDVKSNLDNLNLISIGRLVEEKGFEDLIEVISLVKEKIPDIKLNIVGSGNLMENLQKKVNDYNLDENINLVGYLNKKEMNTLLNQSSLYVMTSVTESFGIVLLEAMSYGVPCIAFDSADGAKNLLKDDVGVLIKNRNKEAMANEIVDLLNNKEKLKIIGDKGYNYCQKYLINNVKEQWLKLLDL